MTDLGARRMALVAVVGMAASALISCANDGGVALTQSERPTVTSQPSASQPAPTEPSTSEPSTSEAATTVQPSTVQPSTGQPSTTSNHAVVRTTGGSIEVAGDGAELQVIATTTADDWTFHIDHRDARRIEASFIRGSAHTSVVIELTPTGIRSSVQSIS